MTTLNPEQLERAREFLSMKSHGGVARALEKHLGLRRGEVMDLSASMNPVAQDYSSLLRRGLFALDSYPDSTKAAEALASAIGVDAEQLVLCNGGAEAIQLVSQVVRSGFVKEPEFSLYRRCMALYDSNGPWWASNPNNPTGALLGEDQVPFVVDEAFYQLATGKWSRRDFERGSYVVGSLTKLFALPGLRMGYVIAPSGSEAAALKSLQPEWPVNSLAVESLPQLLHSIDLEETQSEIAMLRDALMSLLTSCGYVPLPSVANYVYVPEGRGLWKRLLAHKILARDTSSFGLSGGVRIAVPGQGGLARIENALRPTRKNRPHQRKRSLMVVGTSSDSGKSTLVTALCRIFSDRGISVAPFKAQNMSLNSYITSDGREIGRAQARQAHAARREPEVAMNPILLKPTSGTTSQVVVMGEPLFESTAREYQAKKPELAGLVTDAYDDLASRFDLVLLEGAGSPAEINLIENDIVNLGLAKRIGSKAILLGDIDRGGVFASLYGTVEILPFELSSLVCGFVINKIRGDVTLLESGIEQLEALTERPVFGVLPYVSEVFIDSEDSLGLSGLTEGQKSVPDALDIAVILLPKISNFTDFEPLVKEPNCAVRTVRSSGELGNPDLIVVPGSKSTVEDLEWMREVGLVEAIGSHVQGGSVVLGICGGYQILGKQIDDDVESRRGVVAGLGLLSVRTIFMSSKVTLRRSGRSSYFDGVQVSGYQIHHGRVTASDDAPLFELLEPVRHFDGVESVEGAVDESGQVFGTTLHGIFESDSFRAAFLRHVANRRGKSFKCGLDFAELRESQIDLLARLVEKNIDIEGLLRAASIDG